MSSASGPRAMIAPRTSVSRATELEFGVRVVIICLREAQRIITTLTPNSALHAQDLLERVHHLHQVGLVRHDLVDVLVGARDLVEHALVLAADDALRLGLQIRDGKRLLGRVAAHPAPRAVGAGVEALGRTPAPHDVAASAHATRDDAEVAGARADRALAREPDVLTEVPLAPDVVMVAVHRLAGHLEGGNMPRQRLEHEVHHFLSVGARVVLRPADRLDVVVEMPCTFREIGEIPIRKLNPVSLGILLRQLDEVRADRIADAAAARMQHDPDAVRLVEADLDEVVAAAERAELVRPAGALAFSFLDAGMFIEDPIEALLKPPRGVVSHIAVLVLLKPDRHVATDLVEDFSQRGLVKLVPGEGKS